MEFSFHAPPPELASSIKAIWCASGTKQEFESPQPIVPDGCVELIFNLGDRFINAETGELQPRELLAGQMTRPVLALPTGDVDLIGVRLHTGRGGASLRIPMWELQDRLIAASDVIGGLDRAADRLREVNRGERFARLPGELSARLSTTDSHAMASVDHALAMIDASRGTAAIEDIAKQVGITRRHLERQFRDHVGLGAKHVARIARIHTALDLLQQQPSMSGAEIAAACGYSDQAHLIRECQALAGQSPQKFRTTARSLGGLMRADQ
ncbi:MAG TPA: helix-turn-helix transcriptional regulator [Vicinamibacterales bacterium]|nr:helix-turn-helix transcriptional regulator [Vicinamibacterales bacterium]